MSKICIVSGQIDSCGDFIGMCAYSKANSGCGLPEKEGCSYQKTENEYEKHDTQTKNLTTG